MSEKEKKILESITKAVPNMSEFDKGYFLGVGETIAKYKNDNNEIANICNSYYIL